MKNDKYIEEYKIAPLGYELKYKFEEIYFRVHNLIARRYPENIDDRNEILKRYDKIFDTVFEKNKVLGYLSTFDLELNELNNIWLKDLNEQYLGDFDISEEDEEPYYIKVYTFNFDTTLMRKIVLDIADELFDGSILFYCEKTHNIVAPYPGGADIFIKDKKSYTQAKNKLFEWLEPELEV